MPLTKEQAIAFIQSAQAKQQKCDYQGCIKDFTEVLKYSQETGNKSWEGPAYANIGNAHENLGNYQEALTYHQKDLDIALQLGDKGGEGRAYANIGNAHNSLGNYQEALTYHQKDLDIAKQIGDVDGERKALQNIEDVKKKQTNTPSLERTRSSRQNAYQLSLIHI